ncbi:hypothetical protein [Saccharopolyspora sp. NPDC049426]|uniref:hypothetical protein n=1 Tax=Saccharopolyspora sp. NPDC049426 TaxID=3155652 RepID=UPI003412B8A7
MDDLNGFFLGVEPDPVIQLYHPPNVTGSIALKYGFEDGAGIQEVDLSAAVNPDQREYFLVLRLTGGAEFDRNALRESIEDLNSRPGITATQLPGTLPGSQLVLVRVAPSQTESQGGTGAVNLYLSGQMKASRIVKHNARIVLSSPDLGRPRTCHFLDENWLNEEQDGDTLSSKVESRISECAPALRTIAPQKIESTGGAYPNVRLDSADPAPIQDGKTQWESDSDFTASASYVLIDEESRGQSNIFFAGVGAGIVTGIAPIGIQLIFAGFIQLWRPARGSELA